MPMSATRQKKTKKNGSSKKDRSVSNGPSLGLVFLLLSILLVSGLAGLRFERSGVVYLTGEIAGRDVTANRNFLVEDVESTRRKQQEVAEAQPPVFDLSKTPASELEKGIAEIFRQINQAEPGESEKIRWQISERLNREIGSTEFRMWQAKDFQNLLLGPIFPWIRAYLQDGVMADLRKVGQYPHGIIIRDLATGDERLLRDLSEVKDINDFEHDFDDLLKRDLSKPLRVRKAMDALISSLLEPSLSLNRESTMQRKAAVRDAVEPVYNHIRKGEMIVRQGERVTADQQMKLLSLYSNQPEYFSRAHAVGLFLVGLLLVLSMYLANWTNKGRVLPDRDAVFLGSMLLVFGLLAKLLDVLKEPLSQSLYFLPLPPDLYAYLLPVAGGAGVVAMFFSFSMCFFSTLLLSFLCSELAGGGLPLFAFYFIGGVFYTFFLKRTTARRELLTSVFPLLGTLLLTWGGVGLLGYKSITWLGAGAIATQVNGLFSLFTLIILSFIMELVFSFTSRFKLMELMNLEQPLLQELMVTAPGTYHHSLIVSNMVEAGARAIGANPLLSKVAALYHDIGKLKNPLYFIENQFGRENRHDKLAPSMSALILISHVKKGVELAKQHKLGPEITELIGQHHGTSLISYFYKKAQEQGDIKGGEGLREEDYRYPGPKPQTKEAGLILLADVIEASSRTLGEPTPSRIKGHINTMVRNIFSDGQLDESELTLKDLHQASEAFQHILTGIFHSRIEYPDSKGKSDRTEKNDKSEKGDKPEKGENPVDNKKILKENGRDTLSNLKVVK